jgi:hypothetical protein
MSRNNKIKNKEFLFIIISIAILALIHFGYKEFKDSWYSMSPQKYADYIISIAEKYPTYSRNIKRIDNKEMMASSEPIEVDKETKDEYIKNLAPGHYMSIVFALVSQKKASEINIELKNNFKKFYYMHWLHSGRSGVLTVIYKLD